MSYNKQARYRAIWGVGAIALTLTLGGSAISFHKTCTTLQDENIALKDELKNLKGNYETVNSNLELITTQLGEKEETIKTLMAEKEAIVQKTKTRTKTPTRGSGLKTVSINGGSFKSYMDYRAITNKSSLQYELQQLAYTEQGYRKIDGKYVVAVGSGVGSVGSHGVLTMVNGKQYEIVVGDQKANQHTDGANIYHISDGSAIEFIVDTKSLSQMARKMGNIGYCTNVDFSGEIKSITIY